MPQILIATALLALSVLPAATTTAAPTIVFCAPGYPGTTIEAQPTMDAFARVVAGAGPSNPASLAAEYFETEASGVARLRSPDAVLAVVTLPFYAKYRKELALTARLRVVGEQGAEETWSLVARRGAVTSAASLNGWQVVGIPALSPELVRGPILGAWGELPSSARLVFSARVPSSLLKAASGQKIAVLVDSAQAAALSSHPNAKDLEIVTRSKPLPASVVCSVGSGSTSQQVDALVSTLAALAVIPEGREALASLRVRGFEPLDTQALHAALAVPPGPPRAP